MMLFKEDICCPKCGYSKLEVLWCRGSQLAGAGAACRRRRKLSFDLFRRSDAMSLEGDDVEHLELTCGRCKVEWIAQPLDKQPPLSQLANCSK